MAKQRRIFNKSFYYIFIFWYRKLILLTWYDNLTYTENKILNKSIVKKFLPQVYDNGPDSNCLELKYLQKELFI